MCDRWGLGTDNGATTLTTYRFQDVEYRANPRVTASRVDFKRAQDDCIKTTIDRSILLRWLRKASQWQLSAQHFVQKYAKTEDIRALIYAPRV
ncbi:MAG: hypothetical protein AAFV29_24380, partial [Myxococcota bacterium]